MPAAASASIQEAAKSPGATSAKTVPVAGGGTKQRPLRPLSRSTAICARVSGTFTQKLPAPQPAEMPFVTSLVTEEWKGFASGTSEKSASQPAREQRRWFRRC